MTSAGRKPARLNRRCSREQKCCLRAIKIKSIFLFTSICSCKLLQSVVYKLYDYLPSLYGGKQHVLWTPERQCWCLTLMFDGPYKIQFPEGHSYKYYPRANGAKRRSGRKPEARVTNSARLFTPGKMRTQRSVKSINNRGRVTMFQGWTSHWSQKYGGLSGVERAKIQKNICKKDCTTRRKVFLTFL